MTPVSLIVDETANGQMIFSPELGKVLQIYILNPSDLTLQVQVAQKAIANAQSVIDTLGPIVNQIPKGL